MMTFLWLLRDLNQQTARNLGVVYGLTLGLGTMYWFFVVFTVKALPLIFLVALYFALLAQCIAMTKGMQPIWQTCSSGAGGYGVQENTTVANSQTLESAVSERLIKMRKTAA